MAKITHIDVPSAERMIGDLDELIHDFAQAVAQIRQTAADLHGCWGDDSTGHAFSGNYVLGSELTLENSDKGVTELREMRKHLRDALDEFENIDESAGEYLEFED